MALIRVLEIAESTGNFHFSDEQPMASDSPGTMETEEGRAQIADFVKGKPYYDPAKAYLVHDQLFYIVIEKSA